MTCVLIVPRVTFWSDRLVFKLTEFHFFRSSFRFIEKKMSIKYRDFLYTPFRPCSPQVSSYLLTSCIIVVHLLQLKS